jgi:aspartyl-tRNA(Asn)/glutamyl-tRNA(Gln) amidotransferase subunit B
MARMRSYMSTKYYPTIGLEIHAELSTKTKMFCNSPNDPDVTEPNVNVCPVCMGHPGTLPVPNKEAILHMIRIGQAIGGEIANFTEFDRKNYFYPDIPKGYQITQFKYPIVSGGSIAGFDVTRIHLEEDTGTNKHRDGKSLVDFNRAGVPLMELVSEPVMHSAEDAMRFGKELQLLLRYLGASHANMEKGEMRVEVNVSVSPDKDKLGTKVEIKNINSFSAAGRAIEYEIERMTSLWEAGRQDEIVQETRGWDENKQQTVSQRKKENSDDYRYFPEPDIPKLYLHELFDIQKIKEDLPELPQERRERYAKEYGIKGEDIEILVQDTILGRFFEESILHFEGDKEKIKKASNYATSDLVGIIRDKKIEDVDQFISNMVPKDFADLIEMVSEGIVNSRGAKDILLMLSEGKTGPKELAKEHGLIQENDPEALKIVVSEILESNRDIVEEIKGGKEAGVKFLVGQVMKETKGSANPEVAQTLIKELIASM